MTPYSQFYQPMRAVLGDRDPSGIYAYSDDDLGAAIDVILSCGDGPAGYLSDGSGNINPTVPIGDPYALILFQSSLLLINGEEGGGSMRTKALSVSDMGHRKRDLITSFRLKISDIQTGGGLAFETRQSLGVFLQNLTGMSLLDWIDAADYKLPVTIMPVSLYVNPFP